MISAAILAFLQSKLGLAAAGAALAGLVLGGAAWRINDLAYDRGVAACVAAQKAATEAAVARAQGIADRNFQLSNQAAAAQMAAEKRYAELRDEVRAKSHENDARPCIDAAGLDRLRRAGAGPTPGARDPGRPDQ